MREPTRSSENLSDVGRVTVGMPGTEDFDWVMERKGVLQRFLHIGILFKESVDEADDEISIIRKRIATLETDIRYADLNLHCSFIMLQQLAGISKWDTVKAYAEIVGKSFSYMFEEE